jgi:glutamate:GABA antiporter
MITTGAILASSQKPRRAISLFVLAMVNVSIMASLRNLPLVAEYGLSAIFYFLIVGIFFLLPSALVSAELATGWSKEGGIYIWVREALGDRWGFFAIWMQWVHNMSWFPVILSFVGASLAYIINPNLAQNKGYILAVILGGFWGMTFLNYLGIKTSSWFSSIGVILGTILPGLFIIGLGAAWFSSGRPLQTSVELSAFLPDFKDFGNLVFLAGLFLAFTGLEVSAALAGDVKDPQKNYPRSIVIAALVTFFVFMLGSLSISFVIPKQEISLVSGLLDAFEKFLTAYQLQWILPVLAFLLVIGAIAELNSWIVGPVKGLHATSVHGNLPPLFQKVNRHGTPVNLLFFQAVIVTICSLVFLYMPSVSGSYWILSVLSAQIYLVMYILMFITAIVLRYTKPHVPRSYRIPYQYPGIWLFSCMGILAALFAIFIGFFPPSGIKSGSLLFYDLFLGIGLLIMCAIPLIIYQFRKPDWIK